MGQQVLRVNRLVCSSIVHTSQHDQEVGSQGPLRARWKGRARLYVRLLSRVHCLKPEKGRRAPPRGREQADSVAIVDVSE